MPAHAPRLAPHAGCAYKEEVFYSVFARPEARSQEMGARAHRGPVRGHRRPGFAAAMTRGTPYLLAALCATLRVGAALAATPDADALVRAAFDNWRASSSITEITMTVHRPEWERSSQLKAWTRGDADALVRFTAPAQDAGNATLKMGEQTWVFNPRLNQVIKLPASMLAQSWMGSDFSYNDLSKADDLLTQYTHRLVGSRQETGHTVYTVEALPRPAAPVVWGKLVVEVRDDGVLVSETYFDQDMKAVRRMVTDSIRAIGGRQYPAAMSMHPADSPQKWTRIETRSGRFDMAVPDYLFTLSNLRNPRE
jgi:outer membrane lipoprotein-sorting protein